MKGMKRHLVIVITSITLILIGGRQLQAQVDAYERYVQTSQDFKSVKQDKPFAYKAWPGWIYMPWYFQWKLGYGDEAGQFQVEHGYLGALVDGSFARDNGGYTGGFKTHLGWLSKHRLHFYMDHTAGKGDLHIWDGNQYGSKQMALTSSTGLRVKPLNGALKTKLKKLIRHNIESVKRSPWRSAYALDDEPSWGHYVLPTMWQVTDEKNAYQNWLNQIYGRRNAPKRSKWISYNDLRGNLARWSVSQFDASPLMDQWTFNDSYYLNFLGDLVDYANSIDPATPVGIVGGQSPSAFGGYDYAKLMRKIQFIEAYNNGSSQAIIRSFNPHHALPAVTSHFFKSPEDTIWQFWYYIAHGNRGHIGWVDRHWFDGNKPAAWHRQTSRHALQIHQKIGPLLAGAEWRHDSIAIYYNHASIQLGWILDCEPHGGSWPRRYGDHRMGASHQVRHAWENMLRDEGLQYNFLSYVDVIQNGIPDEYKVLILPACLCLSNAEARQIKAFCRKGGTVVADYMPGLWDQHGKGRSTGGVLDDIFNLKHDSNMRSGDVFGRTLWTEVDQDANYDPSSYQQFLTNRNTCIKDESGFNKAVRNMPVGTINKFGKGTGVLMNLSPQWYNAYREAGHAVASRHRKVFMQPILDAGTRRWVDIKNAGEKEHGYEITYWNKGDRTILFVCFNPELQGTAEGEGHAKNLKTQTIPITLEFANAISGVRDERTGKRLGSGKSFPFDWTMNEAIVLSFQRSTR